MRIISLRDWSRACAAGAWIATPVCGVLGVLSATEASFALREWTWCFLVAGVLLGLAAAAIETQINLDRTLSPPPAPDSAFIEDNSEELTRVAMKRAADAYSRSLEPAFFRMRGDL